MRSLINVAIEQRQRPRAHHPEAGRALSLGGPMTWKDKLVTRLEQKNAA